MACSWGLVLKDFVCPSSEFGHFPRANNKELKLLRKV